MGSPSGHGMPAANGGKQPSPHRFRLAHGHLLRVRAWDRDLDQLGGGAVRLVPHVLRPGWRSHRACCRTLIHASRNPVSDVWANPGGNNRRAQRAFSPWDGAIHTVDGIHAPSGPSRPLDHTHASSGWRRPDQRGHISSVALSGAKVQPEPKGAYWHILQTFVGSLIIVVVALVIRFTEFLEIDPLLGMAFGAVMLWASWTILRDTLRILLDSVLKHLDLIEIRERIEGMDVVVDVHHMHAWALTSGRNVFSTHVLVSDAGRTEPLLQPIQKTLKNDFKLYFSTTQIEAEICVEKQGAEDIDFTARFAIGVDESEYPSPGYSHPLVS